MAGTEITSSNKSLSFSLLNHKTRLCTTGTNIQAATKQGGGQEAFATDTSAGLYKGTDVILDPSGTVWQTKMASLTWYGKWGTFYPLTSTLANNTTGLWNGATAVGTLAIASLDTSEGLSATFTTAASGGSQGGINRALLYTTRQFNPSFKLRWKIDEAGANIRFYAGFTGSTSVIGNSNDPLNALAGFGIAINTLQTNYQIYRNDTSGATQLTDTGVAKDTSYHTIELWADDNASKFWWSLDDSTPASATTEIPAQTTSLSCQFLCTAVNADAKVMNVTKSVITSDK
jgi:hypothetical protein